MFVLELSHIVGVFAEVYNLQGRSYDRLCHSWQLHEFLFERSWLIDLIFRLSLRSFMLIQVLQLILYFIFIILLSKIFILNLFLINYPDLLSYCLGLVTLFRLLNYIFWCFLRYLTMVSNDLRSILQINRYILFIFMFARKNISGLTVLNFVIDMMNRWS